MAQTESAPGRSIPSIADHSDNDIDVELEGGTDQKRPSLQKQLSLHAFVAPTRKDVYGLICKSLTCAGDCGSRGPCVALAKYVSCIFVVPFLFAASALGCIDERWNGWMPTQKNLVDEWLAMNERLKQAYPAAVWYLWFLFFGQDVFWDVVYTTVDLGNAETQSELRSHGVSPGALIAASWLSIFVSCGVLLARLVKLRPLMREIDWTYETGRAMNDKKTAEAALWWDRRLGLFTTFGEDFLQATITLITAFCIGKLTPTMLFSLLTSVGASASVCYDAMYKNLWNPQVGALCEFFEAAGGTLHWTLKDNWKSHKSLDEWHGVTCDEEGNVIGLDLSDNGLAGRQLHDILPMLMLCAATLETLKLGGNKIGGHLIDLASFNKLKTLELNDMDLDGQVSNEVFGLLCQLESFDLSGNPALDQTTLVGYLACTMTNLKDATHIDASNRGLKGELPKELCQLVNLIHLYLNNNEFQGELPKELGNLINLKDLRLSSNRFQGELPKELGNLVNLTLFNVANNSIRGELPKELGKLVNLTELYLYSNKFQGELPKQLPVSLEALILDNNTFIGGIPSEWGALTNLKQLKMVACGLDGELPKELCKLINLTHLLLNDNQFRVTEEEKTALKAKLSKIKDFQIKIKDFHI